MVYLIPASQCWCWACDGGTRAPPGVMGGSHCMCPCHSMKADERKSFIETKLKEFKTKLMNDMADNVAFAHRGRTPR